MTSSIEESYSGFTTLQPYSDRLGISVDKANFFISQLFALILAGLLRKYVYRTVTSAYFKQYTSISVGLMLTFFCFGWSTLIMIFLSLICYIVLIMSPNLKTAQTLLFIISMGLLLCMHLERQYNAYASYVLDITGPIMIMVQKLTSITFFVNETDSDRQTDDDENTRTKYRKLTALDFFGYLFQFETILSGPLIFYNDYYKFMHAKQDSKQQPPSPVRNVVEKVLSSLFCLIVFMRLSATYPASYLKSEQFLNESFVYKLVYLLIVTSYERFKYYYAWIFADAICNNSGIGFSGYDGSTLSSKWDLHTNVHILKFEFGLSLRDSINSWNINTNKWLRLIIYDRIKTNPTLWTYIVSACWHGFYPGYYFTFLNGALFTVVSRQIRRSIRASFQKTRLSRIVYDLITFLTTRFVMFYLTFPFIVLEIVPIWKIYKSILFCAHLLAAIAYVVLQNMKLSKRN